MVGQGMMPLAQPASRVVMQARLLCLLREIAGPLGLPVEDAVDLAISVLTDIKAEAYGDGSLTHDAP